MKNFFYLSIFLLFSTQLNAVLFGWFSSTPVSQPTTTSEVQLEAKEKNVATSKFGSRYYLHFENAKKSIHPDLHKKLTTSQTTVKVENSSTQTDPIAKLVIVNALLDIVKKNPDMQDINGNTLLYKSIATNNVPLASLLIENGADKTCCNKKLETPVELAEKLGNKEMIDLLK